MGHDDMIGCFALNFNDSGVDPLTAKIRNDNDGDCGYYFSGQKQICYPTLRDIVIRHPGLRYTLLLLLLFLLTVLIQSMWYRAAKETLS
jgi:hypothetical protein